MILRDTFKKRIYRFTLLFCCLVRAVFSGSARTKPKEIATVIVVLTGKLGDVVCGTPVLRALRIHIPKAQIVLAGDGTLQKTLLEHSHLFDAYCDLSEKGVLKNIRSFHANAACVTGPSFVPSALLYLAGIPLITAPVVMNGFSPAETRLYKILQKLLLCFPLEKGAYMPRERLRALEALGIHTDDTKKQLGFSDEAKLRIDTFFREQKIEKRDFLIGISTSAGNRIKEWPIERFVEIVDYLMSTYKVKVVVFGGKDDSARVDLVINGSRYKESLVNTQGLFSLDELKACMSRLALFISVDTGPIYIAEAFSVPTIDIIGPMDEHEQPPRGALHRVIVPQRTKPELSVLNARMYNREEAQRQTESITSAMVIEEIDSLLAVLKK